MPERFEDAIKALRHIARGNGNVMRIADRIVAAHEREITAERSKAFDDCIALMGEEKLVEDEKISLGVPTPAPITSGLRDTLERCECAFTNSAGFEQVNVTKAALDSMLDAIDAVHANLERENADLKMQYINANRKSIDLEHTVEDLKAELGRMVEECRHYRPDSWESIIYDAMDAGRAEETVDVTPLIRRCKALAGDAQ